MGSATSSIPAEPIVAAVAAVGVLGYGYVHYVQPTAQSDDADADGNATGGTVASKAIASTLHGQKKRGRKLQLPGDATLKNLDILDGPGPVPKRPVPAPVREPASISAARQRQQQQQQQKQQQHPADRSQDVVPGGFNGAVASSDEVRDAQPQQGQEQPAKKQKKKKGGKRTTVPAPSELSSASASASTSVAATSQLASGSTEGTAWIDVPSATVAKAKKGLASESVDETHGQIERWTRVEARKKKAVPPQATATDATTSDAGITTSVTDNSSVVTERTTEDELPPELDDVLEMSTSSLPDAPPRVVPVRPPPGEQPAKGFTWDDYEGVQDDEDASGEDDGGWGVVKSRRRPNKAASGEATTSDPQPLTKKQRQNAQRREALKEVKREREAQQQAAFVSHKRELESARMAEQATTKRTGSRFDSLG
ncbi:hypothetical protein BJV78DRAFT_566320 [Lactifluus subvellereus]|nr:hypothetical protein BJV78DRAFT_566320 [Lactifluus subvellereus]